MSKRLAPGRFVLLLVLAVACKVAAPPDQPAADYAPMWVVAGNIDSIRAAGVPLNVPARAHYAPGILGSVQYKLDAASYAKAHYAPAPRKLKSGAVYVAPGAQVAAPIATAGGAAAAPGGTATTIGKNNAPAATAPGATSTQAAPSAPWWLWLLVVAGVVYIVRRAFLAA